MAKPSSPPPPTPAPVKPEGLPTATPETPEPPAGPAFPPLPPPPSPPTGEAPAGPDILAPVSPAIVDRAPRTRAKSLREIELEKRLAYLEDENGQLKQALEPPAAPGKPAPAPVRKSTPAPRPAVGIVEELNEALGFA